MTDPFPYPLVLGHRGAPLEAPENSLRSFAVARAQGADGVELDVQRSGDGVPVVIHDESLERTGHGQGGVGEHSWAELSRLSAHGEALPSLEQAAAWAAEAGAWLNVELKARGAEAAALAVLERAGILERVVVSSFHPEVVAEVGRRAPEVRRFLLTEHWDQQAHRTLVESGAQGVCLEVGAATELALGVLRREALPVIAWTVDDPARVRELLQAGVAGVITNRPAVAVRVRKEVFPAIVPGG